MTDRVKPLLTHGLGRLYAGFGAGVSYRTVGNAQHGLIFADLPLFRTHRLTRIVQDPFCVASGQQFEQLLCGNYQQPEAQVGGHLHTATHMPSAVVVVQVRVDPFGTASLAIPKSLRGCELAFFTATRVVVNEGDVAEPFGHLPDFLGVISGGGQIIEAGDTASAHLYQRDGGLAIVRAGGGHQPADRDVAVNGVQMQFEPTPGLFLALAVFLRAPVAVPWQVGKILVQRPLELTLQASRLCLLGGLCYRCGRLLCRLLSPMNGGAIATDVPGDLGAVAVDDHRFLNALRQVHLRRRRQTPVRRWTLRALL